MKQKAFRLIFSLITSKGIQNLFGISPNLICVEKNTTI